MEFEALRYVDRKNTNCVKWDGLIETFGEDGLDAFWVADMDFESPMAVREAVVNWAKTAVYGYSLAPDDYYEAFINWEHKQHGLKVEREWIRVTPGIVSGIYWAVAALSEPGDAVAVLKPVYYPFFRAVEHTGRKLVSCDLINENGVYSVDFAALDKLFAEEQVKLMVLSSPHNPVGRVFKKWELEMICAICRKHNVKLISDEIHQDLVYGDHVQIPTLTIQQEGVMTFTAASKTFNLAGLPNSFVVLPDPEMRNKFDAYLQSIRAPSSTEVACHAVRAAYRHGQSWLNSIRQQVRRNFELVRDILMEKAPKTVVTDLEGTYLMWIDLRAYVNTKEATENLVQKTCRIAVDYGDWFGGKAYEGFIRMNLATSEENCVAAANRLGDALAAL